MPIEVIGFGEHHEFDALRSEVAEQGWKLVIHGYWSASPGHSGYHAYYLGKAESGPWVLDRVRRNYCLEDLTEEDIEEGALSDEQSQALWGKSLDEAQNEEVRLIVAVWPEAPSKLSMEAVATKMLQEIEAANGIVIDEPFGGMFVYWPDPA